MLKEWYYISIERSFENIKYVSYPQNADFDDLSIEYKQNLFTKRPIDCLTDNNVEILKVVLIEQSLDYRRYTSNIQKYNFGDLPFDGNEMLIARRQLYCRNDFIIFS